MTGQMSVTIVSRLPEMMAARALRGKGSLVRAAPVPRVQQILDITGIPTFATVYSTATEAVGALKP